MLGAQVLVSGPIRPAAGHGSAATECEHFLGVRIIRTELDRIRRLPAGIGVCGNGAQISQISAGAGFLGMPGRLLAGLGG